MGYLICQNCGGYYKLKEGESAEDFVACECYGQLVYVEELDDSLEKEKISEDSENELDSDVDFECIEITSEDLQDKEESESESESVVKSDLYYSGKEPTVKNRAYYRRFDLYSKPDINQLKRLKDVSGLINALYYDDLKIQQEAAQALSVIGDERALEPLNKIMKEQGGTLKLYAEIAVNQIKSRKYGFKSRNRDNYRDIPSESSKPIKKVYKPIQKSDSIKNKKQNIIPAPDEPVFNKDSGISSQDSAKTKLASVNESHISSAVSNDNITPSKVETEKAANIKLGDDETSKAKLKEVLEFKIENSEIQSVEVQSKDVEPVKVGSSDVGSVDVDSVDVEPVEAETSEVELTDVKPSEIETSEVTSAEVEPVNLKPTDVESQDDKSLDIKITRTEKVEPDIIRPKEVKPFEIQSSKTIKKRTHTKSAPIIMKNVDDTEPSSIGFKKITAPNGEAGENLSKDEEDIYFIRWLGIKNSDKPLIGLIILSFMALIVGVILTMSSQ